MPKYKDRHSETEQASDSKPTGHVKEDKLPGSGREHHGIGETEFARKNRRNETENFLSGLPSGPIGYSGRFGSRPDKGSGGRFDPGQDTSSRGPNPEQPGTGKMSQDPESPELPEAEYTFDFRPDTSSEGSNPKDHEPILSPARNEGFPKYCIDELNDHHYLDVYIQYRIAGGLMKFEESDTGNEYHYAQFPGIALLPYGVWSEDYNNIPPSEHTVCFEQYRDWFCSVHPKPVDVRQAMRFWLDRRIMLWRRQHPTPGSYEEFLQAKRWIGTGPKYEDGYDYIAHQEDTEDGGSLYRMHMTRQQAALDLQTSVGEHGYITELDIDRYLIANYEPMPGEEERTNAARQTAQATMDMIRASYRKDGWLPRDGQTYVPPPPRTREVPLPEPQQHDWDFFYRSLQAPQHIRPRILAKLCSGTTPVFK